MSGAPLVVVNCGDRHEKTILDLGNGPGLWSMGVDGCE